MNNNKLLIIILILIVISLMPFFYFSNNSAGISGSTTVEISYIEAASTDLPAYYLIVNGLQLAPIEILTSLESSFIITNREGCEDYNSYGVIENHPIFGRYENITRLYFDLNDDSNTDSSYSGNSKEEKICFIIIKESKGINNISYRIIN